MSDSITRLGGDPLSPYEDRYGFSRVIRSGVLVIIAGTTSIDANGIVLGDTPYAQAVEVLRKIESELTRAGARLGDVIQTRMYVTDISRADEVGRAHGEFFGEIRPAATMVEVTGLVDPRMLVEIEAVAVVASD